MFYTFQRQSSTSVLGMSRFSITKVNSLSSSFSSTWWMEAQSQSPIFLGRLGSEYLDIDGDFKCATMATLALDLETSSLLIPA